jgi:hypothetical protein
MPDASSAARVSEQGMTTTATCAITKANSSGLGEQWLDDRQDDHLCATVLRDR